MDASFDRLDNNKIGQNICATPTLSIPGGESPVCMEVYLQKGIETMVSEGTKLEKPKVKLNSLDALLRRSDCSESSHSLDLANEVAEKVQEVLSKYRESASPDPTFMMENANDASEMKARLIETAPFDSFADAPDDELIGLYRN